LSWGREGKNCCVAPRIWKEQVPDVRYKDMSVLSWMSLEWLAAVHWCLAASVRGMDMCDEDDAE